MTDIVNVMTCWYTEFMAYLETDYMSLVHLRKHINPKWAGKAIVLGDDKPIRLYPADLRQYTVEDIFFFVTIKPLAVDPKRRATDQWPMR